MLPPFLDKVGLAFALLIRSTCVQISLPKPSTLEVLLLRSVVKDRLAFLYWGEKADSECTPVGYKVTLQRDDAIILISLEKRNILHVETRRSATRAVSVQ